MMSKDFFQFKRPFIVLWDEWPPATAPTVSRMRQDQAASEKLAAQVEKCQPRTRVGNRHYRPANPEV
jgi:hypothetical protein